MKIFVLIFVLIGFCVSAQQTFTFDDSSRVSRIKYDILVLASDSLMGREGGSEYEWRAGNYIISEFTKCGLIPVPGNDGFRQEFEIGNKKGNNNKSDVIKSNNILGYIENNAPYTIVIGGHYDHIGFYYKDTVLYINSGADDNASGASGVMEMARYLSSGNLTKYNYILACWGSEEKGLLGSNHFCSSNLYPFEKIAFYINFDMIGRLGWKTDQLDIFGLGSTPDWDSILSETEYKDYKLKKFAGAVDASDHACFYKNKTPFIYFTSGLPPVYHTPKDKAALINYEGVNLIINYTEDIIGRFDGSKPKFRTVSQKEMNKVYWYFIAQFFN
jgi:hypothetical protein